MDCIEEGRIGQETIGRYLNSKDAKYFQVDWMVFKDGKYRLIEVKNQEIFKPGMVGKLYWDHYGHGLPPKQVEARMAFYHSTRIVPWLFVVEKSDYEKKEGHHLIWFQSLIALEMGEQAETKGAKPRRVYDIKNFNKIYFTKKDKLSA